MKKKSIVLCALVIAVFLLASACNKPEEIIDILPPAPGPSLAPTPSIAMTPSPELTDGEQDPTASPSETAGVKTPSVTHRYNPSELDGIEDPNATPVPNYSYEQAVKLNSDVIGWIKIPNTKVDYPFVQASNNEYYLTHAVDKSDSKSGTIFLDYRCKTSGKHMILFGHNMSKSGTMFNGVNNYSESSFYKNNREFTLTIGSTKHTYRVFAVYAMDASAAEKKKVNAVDGNFGSDDAFASHMNELAKLSKFSVDTTIKASDSVLTLITCNRTNYQNGRFFVHAVKIS